MFALGSKADEAGQPASLLCFVPKAHQEAAHTASVPAPASKAAEAAKFPIKILRGKTQPEADALVEILWNSYRRWPEICETARIDPHSPDICALDVGGGLTTILRLLATPQKWVRDICIDELRTAGMEFPEGVRFINGAAELIPFPDQFFTHVFGTNALDHFDNPELAVGEMQRVLRPDGFCIVAVDVFPQQAGARNILPSSHLRAGYSGASDHPCILNRRVVAATSRRKGRLHSTGSRRYKAERGQKRIDLRLTPGPMRPSEAPYFARRRRRIKSRWYSPASPRPGADRSST